MSEQKKFKLVHGVPESVMLEQQGSRDSEAMQKAREKLKQYWDKKLKHLNEKERKQYEEKHKGAFAECIQMLAHTFAFESQDPENAKSTDEGHINMLIELLWLTESEEEKYDHSNDVIKTRRNIPCQSPDRCHYVPPYTNLDGFLASVQTACRGHLTQHPTHGPVIRHRILRECIQIQLMNGVPEERFVRQVLKFEMHMLKLNGIEPCTETVVQMLSTKSSTFVSKFPMGKKLRSRFNLEVTTKYSYEYYRPGFIARLGIFIDTERDLERVKNEGGLKEIEFCRILMWMAMCYRDEDALKSIGFARRCAQLRIVNRSANQINRGVLLMCLRLYTKEYKYEDTYRSYVDKFPNNVKESVIAWMKATGESLKKGISEKTKKAKERYVARKWEAMAEASNSSS